MTDINHRRKNKKPVNQRFSAHEYQNGYAAPDNKRHLSEVNNIGYTDYLLEFL